MVKLECVSTTCAYGPEGDPGFWLGEEGDICPLCGCVGRLKPPCDPDQVKIRPEG